MKRRKQGTVYIPGVNLLVQQMQNQLHDILPSHALSSD